MSSRVVTNSPKALVLTMISLALVDLINMERRHEVNETTPEGQRVLPALLRHDNFMAKIESHPGIDSPKFLGQYKDSTGRTLKCYHLPKRECELMIMSESLMVQARMYDRLVELEAQAKPAFTLPDFTNPAIAARAWADAIEETQALTTQRDHAVATKSHIGNKREATAMATASVAKRQTEKLKDQLGFNARHATVIAVEGAMGKKFNKRGWRPLKAWCKDNGASSVTVPCARYGKVQAWPAGAWSAVYGIDLQDLFGASE